MSEMIKIDECVAIFGNDIGSKNLYFVRFNCEHGKSGRYVVEIAKKLEQKYMLAFRIIKQMEVNK